MGINLIELALRNSRMTALGYEGKKETTLRGQNIIRDLHLDERVTLQTTDLATTLPSEISTADYILLIDVLEHLPEPTLAAEKIKAAMKPGASILISVPTPMYPKMFGKRFHQDIGHLHDGFVLADTNRMFSGLQKVWHRYSTGPLTWPGVWLYYRLPSLGTHTAYRRRTSRLIDMLKAWGSMPFRFLDFWNSDSLSCSLFVEYKRPT